MMAMCRGIRSRVSPAGSGAAGAKGAGGEVLGEREVNDRSRRGWTSREFRDPEGAGASWGGGYDSDADKFACGERLRALRADADDFDRHADELLDAFQVAPGVGRQ